MILSSPRCHPGSPGASVLDGGRSAWRAASYFPGPSRNAMRA